MRVGHRLRQRVVDPGADRLAIGVGRLLCIGRRHFLVAKFIKDCSPHLAIVESRGSVRGGCKMRLRFGFSHGMTIATILRHQRNHSSDKRVGRRGLAVCRGRLFVGESENRPNQSDRPCRESRVRSSLEEPREQLGRDTKTHDWVRVDRIGGRKQGGRIEPQS